MLLSFSWACIMVSKHYCPCFQVLAHRGRVCSCQYHPRLRAVSSGAPVHGHQWSADCFRNPLGWGHSIALDHGRSPLTAGIELFICRMDDTENPAPAGDGHGAAAWLSQPDHRSAVKGWILSHVVLRCDEQSKRRGTFAFPCGWVFGWQRLNRIVPHCFAMRSTFSQRMAWKDYRLLL